MNAVSKYKEEKIFDSEFGFTIDVSPDSNCGLFRRYHVRNNPILFSDPSGLRCTYWQSTGQIVCINEDAADNVYYSSSGGYSGKGPGKNNPSMQDVKDIGPIPQGSWMVGDTYNSPKQAIMS